MAAATQQITVNSGGVVSVGFTRSPPISLMSAALNSLTMVDTLNLSHGTGAAQANRIYHSRLTTTATINLQNRVDPWGDALTFHKLKLVRIKNLGATDIEVIGNNTPTLNVTPWSTDKITIPPNGVLRLEAGDVNAWAVDTTNKQIRFQLASGTIEQDVDVVFVGVDTS